jgi:hypothetical protein
VRFQILECCVNAGELLLASPNEAVAQLAKNAPSPPSFRAVIKVLLGAFDEDSLATLASSLRSFQEQRVLLRSDAVFPFLVT